LQFKRRKNRFNLVYTIKLKVKSTKVSDDGGLLEVGSNKLGFSNLSSFFVEFLSYEIVLTLNIKNGCKKKNPWKKKKKKGDAIVLESCLG
jgi:hypothetical protein